MTFIKMSVTGIEAVKSDYDKLRATSREAVGTGLLDFMAGVGGLAVEDCPWKTRALARSWFENEAEWIQDLCTLIAGFDIEYAIYVHENLMAHHEHGKAKFLEDNFQANIPDLPQFLADRLNEAFGTAFNGGATA